MLLVRKGFCEKRQVARAALLILPSGSLALEVRSVRAPAGVSIYGLGAKISQEPTERSQLDGPVGDHDGWKRYPIPGSVMRWRGRVGSSSSFCLSDLTY